MGCLGVESKEEREARKHERKEDKLNRKQHWTKKRFAFFLLFFAITSYDLVTDVLFFVRSRQFLEVIRDGRAGANEFVLQNTSFTEDILSYAPGCVEKLNETVFSPPASGGGISVLFPGTAYDDLTCLMGFRCRAEFEANPHFDEGNPEGSFFQAILGPQFWLHVDNQTEGNCQFSELSSQGSIEDLIARYQRATIACFAFLIISAGLSLVATLHNFANYHRKNVASFYDFIEYAVEDMSQLCIQIFVYSLQIELRCWLCLIENGCQGECSGRPRVPELAGSSTFSELDLRLNQSLILIILNVAVMILNAFLMVGKGIYNVRKTRWIFVVLPLSPLILLSLFCPIFWAAWLQLFPLLGYENASIKTLFLVLAIIGTLLFPIGFCVMVYNFYHHMHQDNRPRDPKRSTASSSTMIEMTPK